MGADLGPRGLQNGVNSFHSAYLTGLKLRLNESHRGKVFGMIPAINSPRIRGEKIEK
jgi:hypothetical protein